MNWLGAVFPLIAMLFVGLVIFGVPSGILPSRLAVWYFGLTADHDAKMIAYWFFYEPDEWHVECINDKPFHAIHSNGTSVWVANGDYALHIERFLNNRNPYQYRASPAWRNRGSMKLIWTAYTWWQRQRPSIRSSRVTVMNS